MSLTIYLKLNLQTATEKAGTSPGFYFFIVLSPNL
jgi:hypothetical protein